MNGNTQKEKKMKTINGTTVYDNVEIRKVYNGTPQTFKKCDELSEREYFFIPGNNPQLGDTKKWTGYSPIRVAQTNSRIHGMSTQTLWAVREPETN
jgi:hypothetical protein